MDLKLVWTIFEILCSELHNFFYELADTQSNLGVMYALGEGVLSSNVRAYMWYNLAAFNGNEIASKNKDFISNKMTKEQIGKAQDLSEQCLANSYKDC